MYVMKMKPYYRHGEMTPWGGSMLKNVFMKDAPEDRCGESLEVSALSGMESVIVNGEYEGKTLKEVLDMDYEAIVGDAKKPFPLLLKILDAKETLSVQVHPGDDYALPNEGKYGKTEAWMILNAEIGAKIAFGLKPTDEPLSDIVARGEFESALNWEIARPGDVYYIPHGMVHALGGGVQVYEIQQSSDATYRFWDWGRVGKDGKPRELHTKKALDVTRPNLKAERTPGATVLCEGGSVTYFVSDENFSLARLNVAGRMPLPEGKMAFLTPMGECEIEWDGGKISLAPFETALVPACVKGACVIGRLPVLMSGMPDSETVKAALGYRAENVAGLTE